MAPKKPKCLAKRQVDTSPDPAKKRQKREADPVIQKCEIVAEVLMTVDQWPESLRRMFVKITPDTLGVLKDDRHEYQEEAVGRIQNALAGLEATMQERIAESESKVDDFPQEQARREEAQAAAETALAEKKAEVETKDSELETENAQKDVEEKRIKVDAAQELLDDAKIAQTWFDAELDKAAGDRSLFEAAHKDLYTPLKDGLSDMRKQKAVLARLVKFGEKHKLDQSVVDSLPTPLGKQPEARGPFDGIILNQFEEWFAKCMNEFDAAIAQGAEGKAQRASAVSVAKASFDEAEDLWKTATAAKTREELQQCEKSLKGAQMSLARLAKEVQAAKKKSDMNKDELKAFREGALAAFNELKERTKPCAEID